MLQVLIDSDALFGLYMPSDSHHPKAKAIFKDLFEKESSLFISNLVIQETATVLSYRFGHGVALKFVDRLEDMRFNKIFIDNSLEESAWNLFKQSFKKGTSFVDCSNLAIYKNSNMDAIFSFDRFYKRAKIRTLS